MKNILPLFLCLLFCGNLFAQNEPIMNRFTIKLNTQLKMNREIGSVFMLQGIYPSLQIRNAKGLIHQIEVSGINLGTISAGNTEGQNFALSAGYEFSVPLNVFKNNDDQTAYLGLGLSTTASSYFFDPSTPGQFRQSGANYVTDFYLLPWFQRQITNRLFLDFGLLVNLGDVAINRVNSEDPRIPISQQRRTFVDRQFFNFQQFGFRFGFGVSL